jgi:hypothetical protein
MNFSELPLIPREILFGNPERVAATISPNGSRLMWLAPLNGVINIWLAPRDDLASAHPLTRANGIPVIYAFYPDVGHGFARPQNRNSFLRWLKSPWQNTLAVAMSPAAKISKDQAPKSWPA